MIRRSVLALVCAGSAVAAQQAATEATGVQLRGVDRMSGEVFELLVPTGSVARVQGLEIKLNSCRYPVGNSAGDAFASLEIREAQSGEPFFRGWMIASSPALSAMDHPRYDIWVMRCTTS
jgi:hypothetical protein